MATGGTDAKVEGLGEGGMQWLVPFRLVDGTGAEMFSVSGAGAVVAAGSVTSNGSTDASGNFTVTNTAPFVALVDSTASAKGLKIVTDGNKTELRETAGAAGTLLTLDLANNRVGVATASPAVEFEVTGAATVSGAIIGSSTLDITGAATFSSTLTRASQKRLIGSDAKVGATAGWAVGAATNVGRMATMAASGTASTLVIPLPGLKVGDVITAFGLIGQIESAGSTVTLDCSLRSIQAAAADLTDSEAAAGFTQLSVTADTAVTSANAEKASLTVTVAADKFYYLLVTATTGSSTDIDLAGAYIVVTEK